MNKVMLMMTVAVVIAGCLGHWGIPQKVKFIFVSPGDLNLAVYICKGTKNQKLTEGAIGLVVMLKMRLTLCQYRQYQ